MSITSKTLFAGDVVTMVNPYDTSEYKPGTPDLSQLRTVAVPNLFGGPLTELTMVRGRPSCVPTSFVRLIRRGNLFRHVFGTGPSVPPDMTTEASFWYATGQMYEVRNPWDGCFGTWTNGEALEALNNGTVDVFCTFMCEPGCYTFNRRVVDEDNIERMRSACIQELESGRVPELV
jgi:hypothetical protein